MSVHILECLDYFVAFLCTSMLFLETSSEFHVNNCDLVYSLFCGFRKACMLQSLYRFTFFNICGLYLLVITPAISVNIPVFAGKGNVICPENFFENL